MGAGLRPRTKVVDKPPDPNVRAPVLDPTEMLSSGREVWKKNGPGDYSAFFWRMASY